MLATSADILRSLVQLRFGGHSLHIEIVKKVEISEKVHSGCVKPLWIWPWQYIVNTGTTLSVLNRIVFDLRVRSGIRTHANIRWPECSKCHTLEEIFLESGALDRSAILTYSARGPVLGSKVTNAYFGFVISGKRSWRTRALIPVPLAC